MTALTELAEFSSATTAETLPAPVRASIGQRMLDIAGLAVAASDLETSHAAVTVMLARGGAQQASAVGVSHRLPAASAAFVNGVFAHSLDYDDTHLPSVLHPSASVVPAALAVAEQVDATGADLTAAVAVGLEVAVRLGMAGYDRSRRQSIYFEHGQHATSICGAVGSAAAAAHLHGLGADGIGHAIGIAASMGSGVIEANRTGGTVKRIHCGWAAQSGVTAAELAAAGITGPPTVLEGRFGFLQAWLHGAGDVDALTRGLGTAWSIPDIFFKPYPANHFTHAGIDAALAIRERGISADDIVSLQLGVATPTVRTIGEPIDGKRRPASGYQAQFSGPYTVAAALLGGSGLGLSLADFRDGLVTERRRQALMDRIEVVADEECDAIYPDQFPAVLTAQLRDGSTVVERVLSNRGGPDRPLAASELERKFTDNVDGRLSEAGAATVRTACADLPCLPGVRDLAAALRAAGGKDSLPTSPMRHILEDR